MNKRIIQLIILLFFQNCFINLLNKEIDKTIFPPKENLSLKKVDLVYKIIPRGMSSWNTSEIKYSAEFLKVLKSNDLFLEANIYSQDEYFFVKNKSEYRIEFSILFKRNSEIPEGLRFIWFFFSFATVAVLPYSYKTQYHCIAKVFKNNNQIINDIDYKNEERIIVQLLFLVFPFYKDDINPVEETLKEVYKNLKGKQI
jgi:hypothetical protein